MAKYQKYAEYKNSGVDWLGNIPSHWEIVPVGRLFIRLKRTGFPDQELLSVYRDYGVIPKSSRDDNNNKPSDDLGQYQLVNPNDLVMNKMKAWQGSIAISEYEGIVSPAYFVYQPLRSLFKRALPKYVHYLLRNPRYIAQYLRQSKGIRVNQWDLDPEEFQRIELVLPPKSEQNQIFKFLDYETAKIDSLIVKQEKLIELLKEKRQAVISHAVTKGLDPNVPMKDSGVEWLGEVPEHWGATKIKYVAELTPKKSELSNSDSRLCTFIPMEKLKLGSLVKDEEKQISEVIGGYTYFKDGDLLLAKVTPCFENKNMVVANDLKNGIGFGSSEIYVLRTNSKVNTQFLYYRLQEDQFIELATGAMTGAGGLKRVPSEFLNNFEFALPPLSEQITIKEYLDQYLIKNECLMNKAQSAIQLMKERRTALISAAVTGKIDVRNWQNPNNNNEAKMEFSA